MSQNKQRALAYGRSATSDEEAQKSLDLQMAECVNLACKMDYVIDPSDVLQEVGSGLSLDRVQLNKVRLMAAAREFDALFVYGPHRLSRDPVDLLMLLQEFASHGVAVHFVQGASADTPQADLIDGVRRYVADLERSRHRERTVRGMEAVARSGRMPTGVHGHPFGYRLDTDTRKRVFDGAEAEVVVRAFGLCAEGLSTTRIAETLNSEGDRTRTGQPWTRVEILRMLSNTCYMGVDYYGKTRSVGGGKRVAQPKEEWIEIRGYTPPLIPEPLFQEVQGRLAGLR